MLCCSACGAVYRAELARCTNDGAALVETERDPIVGTRIGTYMVDELIGEGGMGRVYRAHHVHLAHRICALKVLLGDYAGLAAMRIRFATEAKHASKLSHPHIASVFDFGRTDSGLLFLAMEYVEGVSFDELITSEPMEPSRLIHLARQLCEGLAHAHDHGLIHRDFKPENVLVLRTPDGGEHAKIVDFGLAIANDHSDSRVTSTGLVMGTPGYIAPEQCLASEIDHRVDLYALGVTMFEALSGGFLPFDGEPAEVVGRKVSASAPSLGDRAKHAKIPSGLVALVDRLLERKPDRRLADAREVLAALDELAAAPDLVPTTAQQRKRVDDTVVEGNVDVASAPIRSPHQTGLRTEFVRAPSRNRWPLVLAVSGVIVVAAAALVVWLATRTRDEVPIAAATPAQPPPPPARPDPVIAPEPEPTMVVEPTPSRSPVKSPKRAPAQRSKPKQPTPAIPVVEEPPPAPPPPVEPPVAPVALVVSLDGLSVEGALPSATVRRALDRVLPAIRACRVDKPGVVNVRFSIGETRRASRTSANGISPTVAGCVASAIGAVRTETAPDVGDVEVRVRVGFERRG